MGRPSRYAPEVRERAVRMVLSWSASLTHQGRPFGRSQRDRLLRRDAPLIDAFARRIVGWRVAQNPAHGPGARCVGAGSLRPTAGLGGARFSSWAKTRGTLIHTGSGFPKPLRHPVRLVADRQRNGQSTTMMMMSTCGATARTLRQGPSEFAVASTPSPGCGWQYLQANCVNCHKYLGPLAQW